MLKWVNYSVEKAKALSVNISVDVFHSTIGRYLTKAIRAVVLADLALKHLDFLEKNIAKGDLEIRNEVKFPVFPVGEIKGFGFHKAPSGALSHWTVIENGKINNV